MPRPRMLLVPLLLLLGACSHQKTAMRTSFWDPDLMIAGRPAELVVRDFALDHDPILKDQRLYEPRFFTSSDGKGGGYVIMSSAFGNEKSCGPRYTWLYHVKGNRLDRIFRYPFDAVSVQPAGPAPVIRGNYWAYECTVCDDPRNGYMAQIPVRVFMKGAGWKVVPEIAPDRRDYLIREARLVVESAREKYGQNDPEARRMAEQLSRFFPATASPPATSRRPQLSQQPVPRTSVNQ